MRFRKPRSRTCIALVIAGAPALASACHPPTPAASEPGQRQAERMADFQQAREPSEPGTHQATDGWIKSAGKREVVYIQPGHFVEEFADPDNILNQLILNAVNWRP